MDALYDIRWLHWAPHRNQHRFFEQRPQGSGRSIRSPVVFLFRRLLSVLQSRDGQLLCDLHKWSKSRLRGLAGLHKPALPDLLVHLGHGPDLALGHGLDSLCPLRA